MTDSHGYGLSNVFRKTFSMWLLYWFSLCAGARLPHNLCPISSRVWLLHRHDGGTGTPVSACKCWSGLRKEKNFCDRVWKGWIEEYKLESLLRCFLILFWISTEVTIRVHSGQSLLKAGLQTGSGSRLNKWVRDICNLSFKHNLKFFCFFFTAQLEGLSSGFLP